jgi:hypothetical protein
LGSSDQRRAQQSAPIKPAKIALALAARQICLASTFLPLSARQSS